MNTALDEDSRRKRPSGLRQLQWSICLNRVFLCVGFFVLLILLIVVWAEEISRIARNNAKDVYTNGLGDDDDLSTPAPSPTAPPTGTSNVEVASEGTRLQIMGSSVETNERVPVFDSQNGAVLVPLTGTASDFETVEEVSVLIAGQSGNNSLWALDAIVVNNVVVAHTSSIGGSKEDTDEEPLAKRHHRQKKVKGGARHIHEMLLEAAASSDEGSLVARGDESSEASVAPPLPGIVPVCGVYPVKKSKQGRISFLGKAPERFVGFSTNLPDTPFDFNDDVKMRNDVEICDDLVVGGNLTVNGQEVLTVCTDDSACPPLNACQQSLCLESFATNAKICLAAPLAAGGACDDGLSNTLNDVCLAGGVCRGTPVPSLAQCTPLEENECGDAPDCQIMTLCVRSDGESTCIYGADVDSNGEACDDHNPFTINDVCNAAGKCAGTPLQVYTQCSAQEALTCPEASADGCVDISCAKLTGDVRCLMDAREDGIACDDNNVFTANDVCAGGVCVGTPVDVQQSRQCTAPELAANCDAAAQCREVDCTHRADGTFHCSDHGDDSQNGQTCDDGNSLTELDVCVDGECRGTAVEVSRMCTAPEVAAHCEAPAQCRKISCAFLADGSYDCADLADIATNGDPCDDNDPATHPDTCHEGECRGLASSAPSVSPTKQPTDAPSVSPTKQPTDAPSTSPTKQPTDAPSTSPTKQPTDAPSVSPSKAPSHSPTAAPSASPSVPVVSCTIQTILGDSYGDSWGYAEPDANSSISLRRTSPAPATTLVEYYYAPETATPGTPQYANGPSSVLEVGTYEFYISKYPINDMNDPGYPEEVQFEVLTDGGAQSLFSVEGSQFRMRALGDVLSTLVCDSEGNVPAPPTPAPPPAGQNTACCLSDKCMEGLMQSDCENANGVFLGLSIEGCNNTPCNQSCDASLVRYMGDSDGPNQGVEQRRPATLVRMNNPRDAAATGGALHSSCTCPISGSLYTVDYDGGLYKVDVEGDGTATMLLGEFGIADTTALSPPFFNLRGVALSPLNPALLYIVDIDNSRVLQIDMAGSMPIATDYITSMPTGPEFLQFDAAGVLYVTFFDGGEPGGRIGRYTSPSASIEFIVGDDVPGTSGTSATVTSTPSTDITTVRWERIWDFAVDQRTRQLYFMIEADSVLWHVNLHQTAPRTAKVLVGDRTFSNFDLVGGSIGNGNAYMQFPKSVAVDRNGDLYVGGFSFMYFVEMETGNVSVLLGPNNFTAPFPGQGQVFAPYTGAGEIFSLSTASDYGIYWTDPIYGALLRASQCSVVDEPLIDCNVDLQDGAGPQISTGWTASQCVNPLGGTVVV